MKKLMMILTLGALIQPCTASLGQLDQPYEATTFMSAISIHFSSSGTWLKQKEIDALSEELEVYDLTGEVRPELASFVEDAMAANENKTFEMVLDDLRSDLANTNEEK